MKILLLANKDIASNLALIYLLQTLGRSISLDFCCQQRSDKALKKFGTTPFIILVTVTVI